MESYRFRAPGKTPENVQLDLDEVWTTIREDEGLRRRAAALGADVDAVGEESPFEAEQGAEGIGAVELILIGAAARVVGGLGEKALAALWNELIWPRLRPRLGGVEQIEDEHK
ncbi:hypothetical protein ACFZ8E_03960 [Methylobacterium sp. HMF5984]|uniref:hypothetical protein n=1 Tax=Methylobacterium sp. HMF5984 TaxID=3367370 RepID=UPI00385337C3